MVTVDLSIVLLAGLDVENWRRPLDLATARRHGFIIIMVVVDLVQIVVDSKVVFALKLSSI